LHIEADLIEQTSTVDSLERVNFQFLRLLLKGSYNGAHKKKISESIRLYRLLNEPNDSEKDLFILMNEFVEQESHKRASINRQSTNYVQQPTVH